MYVPRNKGDSEFRALFRSVGQTGYTVEMMLDRPFTLITKDSFS